MEEPARDADFLKGKQVAFAGKLACMTRKEAVKLIQKFGGGVAEQGLL